MKIATVVGARPQFVKAAPVSRALRERGHQEMLVHTGQHYDDSMSRRFFDCLGIPDPDINLEVGSGSHGQQTGVMLGKLEQVLRDSRPDAVLVFGDTNSTLAGALAAIKLDIPVVHAEAGERIYRRDRNPEEINRIITDHAAWLNLTSTERARQYLLREGMGPDRARYVGDPMYDVFCWTLRNGLHITASDITPETFGVSPGEYHLSTIHRVENTDRTDHLVHLLTAMDRASKPVLLPMHPRLKRLVQEAGFAPRKNLRLIEAQGYFEFLRLLVDCDKVITDSGGVSKESFFAGKPCIIPMENSWWTDIVEAGWAVETGADCERLEEAIETYLPPEHLPPSLFGDGTSALSIARELARAHGGDVELVRSDDSWTEMRVRLSRGVYTVRVAGAPAGGIGGRIDPAAVRVRTVWRHQNFDIDTGIR
jgi:UDP-N-acetylglucosamine 2-epimerase